MSEYEHRARQVDFWRDRDTLDHHIRVLENRNWYPVALLEEEGFELVQVIREETGGGMGYFIGIFRRRLHGA